MFMKYCLLQQRHKWKLFENLWLYATVVTLTYLGRFYQCHLFCC